MTYASELLQAAKNRTSTTDEGLAKLLGVSGPAISQWRTGKGSPMSQERVIELCDLAGVPVDQRDYWLIGVQRDAVTITSVRRALDVALDRLRPAAAVVGLLVLAVVPIARVEAAWTAARSPLEHSQLSQAQRSDVLPNRRGTVPIMSTARAWLRRAWTRIQAAWVIPRGQPAWILN